MGENTPEMGKGVRCREKEVGLEGVFGMPFAPLFEVSLDDAGVRTFAVGFHYTFLLGVVFKEF